MGIYTKAGDSGFASTMNRQRIPKNSPIFSLLGTLDELNSALGMARSAVPEASQSMVQAVQQDILSFSSELAGGTKFVTQEKVLSIENSIDLILSSIPKIDHFVTPGDSNGGAALDFARTVARRAERELVSSKQTGGISREAMMWTNRLSDLLYAMARLIDATESKPKALEISEQNSNNPTNLFAVTHVGNKMELGMQLCKAVLAKAREENLPVVTAVCDEGGNMICLLRDDGAYIASVDIASNKAYTSVSLQMSTEKLETLCQPGASLYGLQNTCSGKIVIFGGGIPLYVNGKLIGGFGVSGGSAEQDTALAHYADEIFKKLNN